MTDKNQKAVSVAPKQGLDTATRPSGKAPYTSPSITLYGTVADLTLGSAGAVDDLGTTRAI